MIMKVYHHNDIDSQIRLVEDGKVILTLYGTYAPSTDITFILEDVFSEEGKIIKTKVVGMVYGNEVENLELLESQKGSLEAEFEPIEGE